MSAATEHAEAIEDPEVEGYEALRSFKFNGRAFSKGDPITASVLAHRRFESLISTGYIRAVRA